MENSVYIFLSFLITAISFIPFINLLYKIKLSDPNPSSHRDIFGKSTPIFKKLRSSTAGTPIGGGFLIVLVVSIITLIVFWENLNIEIVGILVTFISFMLLGLFDDLKKTFHFKGGPFELRVSQKFILELIISSAISYWLVSKGIIHISIPGLFDITNPILLTVLSSIGMTFMLNAFNITDGVDGLSGGTLVIALIGVLALAGFKNNANVSIFTSLLLGALVSYLYFNIHPARLLMGDTGSLAFGSVFCLLFLLLDFAYLIPIFGFIYIAEAFSSLIQWFSRRFLDKKVFDSAPLHYHFENRGWSQSKVTMRAYVLQATLIMIALSLAHFLT
jgi:phospho-N-acetylmuramoyl-pentapeptide-transferase